jgi:hypothetical protein
MNNDTKADYIALYTDLKIVQQALKQSQASLVIALDQLCKVYAKEAEALGNKQPAKRQLELDVVSRAVMSTGLSLLIPQMISLSASVEVSLKTCEIAVPEIANTTMIQ